MADCRLTDSLRLQREINHITTGGRREGVCFPRKSNSVPQNSQAIILKLDGFS